MVLVFLTVFTFAGNCCMCSSGSELSLKNHYMIFLHLLMVPLSKTNPTSKRRVCPTLSLLLEVSFILLSPLKMFSFLIHFQTHFKEQTNPFYDK